MYLTEAPTELGLSYEAPDLEPVINTSPKCPQLTGSSLSHFPCSSMLRLISMPRINGTLASS